MLNRVAVEGWPLTAGAVEASCFVSSNEAMGTGDSGVANLGQRNFFINIG